MNLYLDWNDSHISADRVIEQLHQFGLYSQLLQEIAINDLIEKMAVVWSIDLDNTSIMAKSACAIKGIEYAEIAKLPLCQGMNENQLKAIYDREVKLQKFKLAKWGDEVETYFKSYGVELDRVLISILQVKDAAVAQELFFRIQAGEKSFAEVVIDHSQGNHAHNGGIIGPVLLGDLNPGIRQILEKLKLGELSSLFQIDSYYTFIRLDKREPAILDEQRYQFLLDKLFSNWLKCQV
jgi:PPIC-type PPIASE domain